MLVSAIFLTHFTLNNVFGDLANQRIDFWGVQSNLQSNINYRRNNMRLELEFFVNQSISYQPFNGNPLIYEIKTN